jgi:DNA repair protein RadD
VVARGYNHADINLNSTGMDFDQRALKRYNEEKGIIKIIASVIKAEESKHILVFTSNVEESKRLTTYLKELKISCETISSETPKKEREDILNRFKSGKLRVVANMGVLVVGFDFPELDCLILARPTQSISLYYQMVGRGIRIANNKDFVKIIDLAGNVPRFGKMETFEFVEEKKGLHRMKSSVKYLTGYDYVNNKDLEAIDYKGFKESSFAQSSDIIQFGVHKGKHISKIPN